MAIDSLTAIGAPALPRSAPRRGLGVAWSARRPHQVGRHACAKQMAALIAKGEAFAASTTRSNTRGLGRTDCAAPGGSG